MGCGSSKSKRNEELTLMVKKLKYQAQIKIKNLTGQCLKKEKQIVMEFKKQLFHRSRQMQYSLIQQIVSMVSMIHIYEVIILHSEKISNYSHHINDWAKSVETLHPSFRLFLFIQSILKDYDFSQVCKRIKVYDKQIPQASIEEISDEIILHYKINEDPTEHMCNQYILKLCNQQNLDIEYINAVGHNFRFGY